MSDSAAPKQAHCRICGSTDLNVAHYALEMPDKVGLYRALTGGSSVDQLIRPCNCRGSFAFAHKVCLSNWIEATKHEFCDVCRFQYNVDFYERTIFEWASEGQQVCRIIKTLCVSALVYYVSALGVLNHFQSRRTPINIISVIVLASSSVWAIFCTVVLIGFAVNLLMEFRDWRQVNRLVVVKENNVPLLESPPNPKDILKSSGFKGK